MGTVKRENRFFPMVGSIFRDTTISIERNNLMSLASILSVMAALIILGIFTLFSANLTYITDNIESALEMKVFLQANISEAEQAKLESYLQQNALVKDVRFESKDEALDKFSDSLEEYSGMLEGYNSENNPLASSYVVSLDDPSHFEELKAELEATTGMGVDYVKYGEDFLNVMMDFSNFSQTLSLIILGILTIISIFVIYNTIKLTCFARRREISFMKYVGATNWYIRMPFVLEGMFLGGIGAVIATLILRTAYLYILAYVNSSVYLPMDSPLLSPSTIILPIFIFGIVYGVVIGAFGSIFSIRKFLDV